MAPEKLDTSIFTDDSGGRKRAVALAIRGAVVLLGLGATAVAVSVFGNVKLPGLEEPLHIPGTQAHSNDHQTSTRDAGKTPGSGQTPTSTVVPAGQPTTAATPTPTATATGKPTAKPTTAAQPTHKPTAPPGKPTSAPTP